MARGVKRPDETRAQITRAAADALGERGYDGVRVQDVARRAGLTTGAIYAHFHGRAALIAAAVESRTSSVVADLDADGAQTGDSPLPDRLVKVALALLTAPTETGNLLELEALVAARREPELASLLGLRLNVLHRRLAEGVALAQDRGELRADLDVRAVTYFCHALLLGLLLLDSAADEKPNVAEWERLVRALVAGMANQPVS